MTRKNTARLLVEVLEDRLTPSFSTFALDGAGNLKISGTPTTNLLLTNTAGGIQVFDGATDLGTYAVTGDINVQISNSLTGFQVVYDAAGLDFGGSIHFTAGNALTTQRLLVINSSFTAARIDGNVWIKGGNGPTEVDIVAQGSASVSAVGALHIGGSVNIDAGAGSDTANIGSFLEVGTLIVDGNLSSNNANNFVMGPAIVHGSLFYTSNKGLANDISLALQATIDNHAIFTGSPVGDTVNLAADIGNALVLSLGNGSNSTNFNDNFSVAGNATYIGGGGTDLINLGAGQGGVTTAFMGNLSIITLGGNDSILLTNGAVTTTVAGSSIVMNLGDGNDSVALTAGTLNAGGARMNYFGGNGADQLAINFPNVLLSRLFADFGNGADIYTPTGIAGYPVTLLNL